MHDAYQGQPEFARSLLIFCSKILLLFVVGTLIFCLVCSIGVHGDADLQQNSEVDIRDTVVPVLCVYSSGITDGRHGCAGGVGDVHRGQCPHCRDSAGSETLRRENPGTMRAGEAGSSLQ